MVTWSFSILFFFLIQGNKWQEMYRFLSHSMNISDHASMVKSISKSHCNMKPLHSIPFSWRGNELTKNEITLRWPQQRLYHQFVAVGINKNLVYKADKQNQYGALCLRRILFHDESEHRSNEFPQRHNISIRYSINIPSNLNRQH